VVILAIRGKKGSKMEKVLILDYSVDRSETAVIRRWLVPKAEVASLFIDTAESFPDHLIKEAYTYVIHTGSALSITQPAPFTPKAVKYIRDLVQKRTPQMGICYGHQLICLALLGPQSVRKSPLEFEAGWREVSFLVDSFQIPSVSKSETLWQNHFDEVVELPEESQIIATGEHTQIQAYINTELRLFGTQFHPEFDREKGNEAFLKDRELLAKHGFNVDEIIKTGPSIESGKVFFNFFLDYFNAQ
jgi:GMP synthase (glutamine-hydrolysing)